MTEAWLQYAKQALKTNDWHLTTDDSEKLLKCIEAAESYWRLKRVPRQMRDIFLPAEDGC